MISSRAVPLTILFGGIIVAVAVYIVTPHQKTPSGIRADLMNPVDTQDHILGNPNAPIKIVEYADFDCAPCKKLDSTLHQVIDTEGASGQVAWVYREFPLTELHPNALSLAEAAECAAHAGGNDGFWSFASLLFKDQPVNPLDYGALAGTAGLPGESFAQCFSAASTTVLAQVMQDRNNALSMGAEGAPFSILLVTGKSPQILLGTYPYVALRQIIDNALASLP